MLSKEVVARYGEKVRFVSEDWGESRLAARFGIKRYPVVFVDDVLVAQPKDFGGWGDPTGKYAPWGARASQVRFQTDLGRVIDVLLSGDTEGAARLSSPVDTSDGGVASLPAVSYTDLHGKRIEASDLAGKVVVVDVWATWCVPCRKSLPWLTSLEREYGDKVVVLALTVQSPEKDVLEVGRMPDMPSHIIPGGDALVGQFGGVASVPVLFVFDGQGKKASTFVGSPDDLHDRAGALIRSLVGT